VKLHFHLILCVLKCKWNKEYIRKLHFSVSFFLSFYGVHYCTYIGYEPELSEPKLLVPALSEPELHVGAWASCRSLSCMSEPELHVGAWAACRSLGPELHVGAWALSCIRSLSSSRTGSGYRNSPCSSGSATLVSLVLVTQYKQYRTLYTLLEKPSVTQDPNMYAKENSVIHI
jgi:hypothetical protein